MLKKAGASCKKHNARRDCLSLLVQGLQVSIEACRGATWRPQGCNWKPQGGTGCRGATWRPKGGVLPQPPGAAWKRKLPPPPPPPPPPQGQNWPGGGSCGRACGGACGGIGCGGELEAPPGVFCMASAGCGRGRRCGGGAYGGGAGASPGVRVTKSSVALCFCCLCSFHHLS